MAKSVPIAFTQLAGKNRVVLTIEGLGDFEVLQATVNFARNQIPDAMCALALGRNARNLKKVAKLHEAAAGLRMMRKATLKVWLTGKETPDGNAWPNNPFTLFEGYYIGYGYRKSFGTVQLVVHLYHWLADLGFTSCINSATHPQSHSSLVAAAIMEMGAVNADSSAAATEANAFLPSYVGTENLIESIGDDLWYALRKFMFLLASLEGFKPQRDDSPSTCRGADTIDVLKLNNRGARALLRIEGPDMCQDANLTEKLRNACNKVGVANRPYKFGKVIKPGWDVSLNKGIADRVGPFSLFQVASQTLWDYLTGYLCPMFGLDLCPSVEQAIIMPQTPGWRGRGGEYWRTIRQEEYMGIEESAMVSKPLRGVVIGGGAPTASGVTEGSQQAGGPVFNVAGFFAAAFKNDEDKSNGAVLYENLPPWLAAGITVTTGTLTSASIGIDVPSATATSPAGTGKAPDKTETPAVLAKQAAKLADCYARMRYIQNMLRGRTANIVGRLRFDIAPGSHVKILGSPERFLATDDQAATPRYGQVARVSIEINAENQQASTSFQIVDLRNPDENSDDRTSIEEHPLFVAGTMGYGGAPLVADLYDGPADLWAGN